MQNLCFLIYNSTSSLQERLSALNNLLSMKVLHPESGTYWGSNMLVPSFLLILREKGRPMTNVVINENGENDGIIRDQGKVLQIFQPKVVGL